MKTANRPNRLLVASLALLAVTLAFWGLNGAHLGWTQTSVVEMHVDEITEIEYPVRRDTFVAGVEVLGLGALLSAALAGASLLPPLRRRA